MNSNDALIKLKYSLQALAQPASIQLKLFPDFVQVADELALDFEHRHSVVAQNSFDLTSSQKESLAHLDALLSNMSKGIFTEELWTDNALRDRHEWEEVRSLAKETLKEFNWALDEPPVDRNQYVRSSNQK